MVVLSVVVQFRSLGSRFRVLRVGLGFLLAALDTGVDFLQTFADSLRDWWFGGQMVSGYAESLLVGGVLHVDDLAVRSFIRVGTLLDKHSVRVGIGEVLQVAGLFVDDVVTGLISAKGSKREVIWLQNV